MGTEVWRTFDKIDPNEYLYHYTSIETLLKILYFDSLRFSNLCKTNDLFEQKPKIIFESSSASDFEEVEKVKAYLNGQRKRVKILCFSQDSQYNSDELEEILSEIKSHLSSDKQKAHMFGRGFALARMWAQYATNNQGVCIIFKKKELIQLAKKQNVLAKAGSVVYKNAFDSFVIDNSLVKAMAKLIQNSQETALTQIIAHNSLFVEYNYFSKLTDWSGENEFRMLSISQDPDDIVEIHNIGQTISGILLGGQAATEYQFFLFKLFSEHYDIRRICFDDDITRIEKILFEEEKKNDYSKCKPV